MPPIDFLSAIANTLNQQRLQQQGQGNALQQALLRAQIEQRVAQSDPLNQLLRRGTAADAELKIRQAGGPLPSLFRQGQPQGQIPQGRLPQPQLPQTIQPQLGQIQRPQLPIQPRTQPNIQQLGQQRGQVGQPSLQTQPRTGDFVPKELDIFRRPTGFKRLEPTPAQQKLSTERAVAITKSKAAQRLTINNLKNIGGQVNELSQIYADAIGEGGFGNAWNFYLSKVRLAVGGKQADELGQTAAYPGILNEIVAAIMPTLTQQGDRPGSVRLVESIYRKIRESFPQGREYAGNAQNMIRVSIRNAYRKAKVINEMALSNDHIDSLSEKDLSTLADKINQIADQVQIKLGSDEDKALKNFINQSTQPLLRLLEQDLRGQSQFQGQQGQQVQQQGQPLNLNTIFQGL